MAAKAMERIWALFVGGPADALWSPRQRIPVDILPVDEISQK